MACPGEDFCPFSETLSAAERAVQRARRLRRKQTQRRSSPPGPAPRNTTRVVGCPGPVHDWCPLSDWSESSDPDPPVEDDKKDVPDDGPPELDKELGDLMVWNKVVLPFAMFVLDPRTLSIGCHCRRHGVSKCRINKMNTKQPIGYFFAWLAAADGCLEAGPHKDCRHRELGDNAVVSYEQRVAGRARAEALLHTYPDLEKLFSLEIPIKGVEPKQLK